MSGQGKVKGQSWIVSSLMAAETRPETAVSSNSVKMLLRVWQRCHVSKRLMLSTGQYQGQVKWGHYMKIYNEYRVTHVLWVIWSVEFDGDTHFHIWPKVRSSSGQRRSNFETQKFLFKTCLSCPVLSQDSKKVICFDVGQLEMPKMRFKKVTSSPLPGFWAIAQPEM